MMAQANIARLMIEKPVLDLIERERAQALSSREWQFRLAGYGYAIKTIGNTRILTSLPHGVELGVLPASLH